MLVYERRRRLREFWMGAKDMGRQHRSTSGGKQMTEPGAMLGRSTPPIILAPGCRNGILAPGFFSYDRLPICLFVELSQSCPLPPNSL